MYLEYVLNQPAVIQEMESQSDPIVRELEPFDAYIENAVFDNLEKLVGDSLIETFNNISAFVCDRTIEFIDHTVTKLV